MSTFTKILSSTHATHPIGRATHSATSLNGHGTRGPGALLAERCGRTGTRARASYHGRDGDGRLDSYGIDWRVVVWMRMGGHGAKFLRERKPAYHAAGAHDRGYRSGTWPGRLGSGPNHFWGATVAGPRAGEARPERRRE